MSQRTANLRSLLGFFLIFAILVTLMFGAFLGGVIALLWLGAPNGVAAIIPAVMLIGVGLWFVTGDD